MAPKCENCKDKGMYIWPVKGRLCLVPCEFCPEGHAYKAWLERKPVTHSQ